MRKSTESVALLEIEETNGVITEMEVIEVVDGERDGFDDGIVEAVRGVEVELVGGVERGWWWWWWGGRGEETTTAMAMAAEKVVEGGKEVAGEGSVQTVDIIRTKARSFAYFDFLPSSLNSLPKLFTSFSSQLLLLPLVIVFGGNLGIIQHL